MTTTREEAIELISTEFDWDEIADPVREHFIRLIDLARAKQNEACAKVCDMHARGWKANPGNNPMAGYIASSNCADNIRARMKPLKSACTWIFTQALIQIGSA